MHKFFFKKNLCFSFGRFFFDWHNPFGYALAFSIELIWGTYSLCVLTYQTSFFIGSCGMLISLAEDMTIDLNGIDKAQENQSEFTERFRKFIQLHSDAKELRKILIVSKNEFAVFLFKSIVHFFC